MSDLAGASIEVLRYHWDQHDQQCGSSGEPPVEAWCPCGRSGVLRCGHCDGIVFLIADPGGGPLCLHGHEVRQQFGTPPWRAA